MKAEDLESLDSLDSGNEKEEGMEVDKGEEEEGLKRVKGETLAAVAALSRSRRYQEHVAVS